MFRSVARVVLPVGMVFVSALASVANAQVSPSLPNPIAAPNPLTTTLSIFRSNMQDKIMKSADAMPEPKYSYRPTKDVRSFAEILNHVADQSCPNYGSQDKTVIDLVGQEGPEKSLVGLRLAGAITGCPN